MLSNAYFIANFRFDTAENEPVKNLQKLKNLQILLIFSILLPREGRVIDGADPRRAEHREVALPALRVAVPWGRVGSERSLPNFPNLYQSLDNRCIKMQHV